MLLLIRQIDCALQISVIFTMVHCLESQLLQSALVE